MIEKVFFTTLTVYCFLLSCTKETVTKDAQVLPPAVTGTLHNIDFKSEGSYEIQTIPDDYDNLFDNLVSKGSGKGTISGGAATIPLNASTNFSLTYCIASGPMLPIPVGTTYSNLDIQNSDGSFGIRVGTTYLGGKNFEGVGTIIPGSGAFQKASSKPAQLLNIKGTIDTTTKMIKLHVTGPIFL